VAAKSAAYSATTLAEAAANDGSITATLTITLTNETFTGADGDTFTAHVSNVPTGLTAVLTRTSSTVATLSFTGSATAHANAQDVANLTVAFVDGDFTGGSAANVTGVNKSDLAINFADPVVSAPVDTTDYAAIAAANAKVAADKLAAEKAAAEKAIADAKAAAEKAEADAKAAAEKAIADAKAAAEAAVKAAEEKAAEEAAAAVVAAAEKKAAANTVKIASSSKSTKLTLNLADKYYGRIAYVQVVTKTKTGVKTTTLDYFVIENEDGTANITVKKLAKGQKLQVRIGKTIVFSKSL